MLNDAVPPPHRLPDSPVTPEGPQVLLVNDMPELRRLKRLLLEQAGYTVAEVLDGQKTLTYLRESSIPLVVVMNTRIPSLNATGLLRIVSVEPSLKCHAFVLTTALASQLPDELVQSIQNLQVQVLGKPFTQQDLLDAVATARKRLHVHGAVSDTAAAPDEGDDPPVPVQPCLQQGCGHDRYRHPVSA
jgi:CheY-like chemotaxis protein